MRVRTAVTSNSNQTPRGGRVFQHIQHKERTALKQSPWLPLESLCVIRMKRFRVAQSKGHVP